MARRGRGADAIRRQEQDAAIAANRHSAEIEQHLGVIEEVDLFGRWTGLLHRSLKHFFKTEINAFDKAYGDNYALFTLDVKSRDKSFTSFNLRSVAGTGFRDHKKMIDAQLLDMPGGIDDDLGTTGYLRDSLRSIMPNSWLKTNRKDYPLDHHHSEQLAAILYINNMDILANSLAMEPGKQAEKIVFNAYS